MKDMERHFKVSKWIFHLKKLLNPRKKAQNFLNGNVLCFC